MRKQIGFTLIELMIVIVIITIISAVAYPAFTRMLLKAHRAEAKVALNEIALAQERYYTMNGTFGTIGQLGQAYTDAIDKMTDQDGNPGPDYYNIVMVPAAPTNAFTLTATAAGVQADDTDCAVFTLNQLGAREAEDSDGNDAPRCW